MNTTLNMACPSLHVANFGGRNKPKSIQKVYISILNVTYICLPIVTISRKHSSRVPTTRLPIVTARLGRVGAEEAVLVEWRLGLGSLYSELQVEHVPGRCPCTVKFKYCTSLNMGRGSCVW